MPFNHLHALTTPGAADEVVDWFATFQAWITGTVGWVVANGAGTTDLTIRSIGELGGLTMLFVRIWRDGGFPNRIRAEVQNAHPPTQATTTGGYIDTGGVQFEFWISADRDAIHIAAKVGAGYRMVHEGMLMPFALTLVDETYCMVSSGDVNAGRILRRHDGLWNQADNTYENPYLLNARRDRDDNSLSIGGLIFADNADIAGEYKHISCQITDPVAPEDAITTTQLGATSTWVILADDGGRKYALRTGGVLPTGVPDGAMFAHAPGIAANIAAWFGALNVFMLNTGWTATDISGLSGMAMDMEYHSTGETGLEDIWLRVWNNGGANTFCHVADATFGAPGRHETAPAYGIGVGVGDFPAPYYFTADLDCLLMTTRVPAATYESMWMGLTSALAPNLTDSYMKSVINRMQGQVNSGRILHDHGGAWSALVNTMAQADGPHAINSNPNNYDGTTYLVWPMICSAFGDLEPVGQMKYFFASDGGGLAQLDTITVGARVYTVFIDGAGNEWAMRTT